MSRKNLIVLSLALLALLLIFLLSPSPSPQIEPQARAETPTRTARKKSLTRSTREPRLSALLEPVADSIRPHPLMREGELASGLKYKILTIPDPGRQVSLRLVIEAGSLMEEDHECGMAHFLEHLAFNGTRNFPEGRAMQEFQRLGLRPAQHANASTSYQHTVYKLDLPNDSEEALASSLHFFRDIFDGLFLRDQEIDLELAVVLQEKLQRSKSENGFELLLPESLVAKRHPIGLTGTLSKFNRQDFLNFHQKWYTPNRGTLILTGDIDPDQAEALIRERFGSLVWRERAPDPELGTFTPEESVISHIKTDQSYHIFTLKSASHPLPPPTAPGSLRTYLIDFLTSKMLRSRWRRISEDHHQFVLSPASHTINIPRFAQVKQLDVAISSGTFDLDQFLTEWHRLLQHGFLPSELSLARKNLLLHSLQQAEELTTRSAAVHADHLVRAVRIGDIYTSPLDDLARVQASLPMIQLEECLAHLRSLWIERPTLIQLSLKEGQAAPTDPASRFRSLRNQIFPPLTEPNYPTFSRPPKGQSSPVISREEFPKLKLTKVTLKNGLQINLRPTPNHSKLIHLRLTFGRGKHSIPPHRPGIPILTKYVYRRSGIRGMSQRELEGSLQHQFVNWDFHLHLDHFSFTGLCTRPNLLTQCQILYALLVEPGWMTDHRYDLSHTSPGYLEQFLSNRMRTPTSYWRTHKNDFITNQDSRFRVPTGEELFHTTNDELRDWLEEDLLNNPLELTLTGDFDLTQALGAIRATFAKLPLRKTKFPPLPNDLAVFDTISSDLRTIDSPGNKACVSYFFHTPHALSSLKMKAHLTLLKDILQSRVTTTIREKLGLAYSPRVDLQIDDNLSDLNYLVALIPTGAQDVTAVVEGMTEVLESFLDQPITTDEVERARTPLLKWQPLKNASPRYWAETLKLASRHPSLIADLSNIEEAYKNTTPPDLQKLALRFITYGACEFTVTQ